MIDGSSQDICGTGALISEALSDSPMVELDRLVKEFLHASDPVGAAVRFDREFPPLIARLRRWAGLTPVPSAPFGYFESRLRDGSIGYFQRRTDDCLQAAIASLCQIAPHEVSDLRLHERVGAGLEPADVAGAARHEMDEWLAAIGLRRTYHPIPPRTGKWIGVAIVGEDFFDTHCLLMSGRDVLFDPANVCRQGGMTRRVGQPGATSITGSRWIERSLQMAKSWAGKVMNDEAGMASIEVDGKRVALRAAGIKSIKGTKEEVGRKVVEAISTALECSLSE